MLYLIESFWSLNVGNWRVILGEIQDTSSQTDIVRE